MKKYALTMVVLVAGLSLEAGAFAQDKDAINKQVDDIVMAIDGGKNAADFASAANNKPNYVYIMEKGGNLLVHPSLLASGQYHRFGLSVICRMKFQASNNSKSF